MDEFKYSPIDHQSRQIRLVYIPFSEGGVLNDEIQCRLQTFDLSEAPHSFTALSYTWGSRDQSKTLSINGSTFHISENLWSCLRYINARRYFPKERYDGSGYEGEEISRWLWIDQICIQQAATDERNHQVKLMSDIYTMAEIVLIWAGESNKVSGKRFLRSDTYVPRTDYETVWELGRSDYWRRLWIVQEVLLAKDLIVLFGPTVTTWSYARNVLQKKAEFRHVPIISRKVVPSINTNRFALHRALELFSGYECEDPRDKIYGLMGIVTEKQRIVIDYHKSAAVVFWDAVATFQAVQLQDPESIIELGGRMGVTGQEEVCQGLALENFRRLFAIEDPASVFQKAPVAGLEKNPA